MLMSQAIRCPRENARRAAASSPDDGGHHSSSSVALSGTQRHLVRQELLHDGLRSQRLEICLRSNVDDDHKCMQLDGLLENLTRIRRGSFRQRLLYALEDHIAWICALGLIGHHGTQLAEHEGYRHLPPWWALRAVVSTRMQGALLSARGTVTSRRSLLAP